MQKDQPQIVEPFTVESKRSADSFTLTFAYEANGERREVHLRFPSWWRDVIKPHVE